MRTVTVSFFPLLALITSFCLAETTLSNCNSDENLICAPVNPEDLLSIPATVLVLVSSMEDNGHLYVSNTKDLSSHIVFPTVNAKRSHDKHAYPDCPGPLSLPFRPHGLAMRQGENGAHTLYVVGHGAREAIEVFALEPSNTTATLTWIGCVVAPQGVSLNSVAPLPNGAFVTTNFNLEGGEVWEWQLGSGWSKVPGSDMLGPNGIVASPDGKWLYIGGWQDEALIRLSRNKETGNKQARGKQPFEKQLVKVGFHIDNVRWGKDGSILVAGQKGIRENVGACLRQGQCEEVATGIAKIDVNAMQVVAKHELPSDDKFILGTVAIDVGNDIWVGGIAGGTYIGRFQFD